MKRSYYSAALVIAATVTAANAAAPVNEICYSAAVTASAATPPTNETVFTCPASGSGTLPELASRGLTVVKLTPMSGANLTISHQLVLKRTVVVHADGFEP